MSFERFGRSYHLRIHTAEDLQAVLGLDKALWVSTVAPVDGLRCDSTFLKLIDSDNNGLIIPYEMREAIQWLFRVFKDTSRIADGSEILSLDALNTDDEKGRIIHNSASKMLRSLQKNQDEPCGEISISQIRQIKIAEEARPVSEAGVVIPAAAQNPELAELVRVIISIAGGVPHPSGKQGVNEEEINEFIAAAKDYLEWHDRGTISDEQEKTDIMPLGSHTLSSYNAYAAIRDKIDQYFSQCNALELDPKLADHIGPREAELQETDFDNPEEITTLLLEAPLSPPRADGILVLDGNINPQYKEQIASLRSQTLQPIIGEVSVLSRDQWQQIKDTFAAHQMWLDEMPRGSVGSLGKEKLTGYLESGLTEDLRKLTSESLTTSFVLDNIRLVEKAALYQKWLLPLANNFVSFPDLYHVDQRAMFEQGTLIMDGRHFSLVVRADDIASHSKSAKTSNMFVIYVEATRKADNRILKLAAPITSGTRGNLYVGKRGVFVDVSGVEWDARILQVIENPVSLGEAMISPFKRLGNFITGKIESLTATAEKKMESLAGNAVIKAQATATAPAQTANVSAGRRDMLMGIGVAGAALASSVAFIVKSLSDVRWWKISAGIGAVAFAVMLPTVIIAIIKLRRRDLSSILEGSGWAINARMRLTRKLSAFFTSSPPYPKGAKGTPGRHWLVTLIMIVLIIAIISLGTYWLSTHRQRKRPVQVGPIPAKATAVPSKTEIEPEKSPAGQKDPAPIAK